MTAFSLPAADMVLAVRASVHAMPSADALVAGHHDLRHGLHCSSRREWSISSRQALIASRVPAVPGHAAASEFATSPRPFRSCRTFCRTECTCCTYARSGLSGVVALRRKFIPILLVCWVVAWLGSPSYSPFHYGRHVLLLAAIVAPYSLVNPKFRFRPDVEWLVYTGIS